MHAVFYYAITVFDDYTTKAKDSCRDIYPGTSEWVCARVLPSLNRVSKVSFKFEFNGKLLYFLFVLHFRLKLTSGDPS